ncbi:uncharacterized protein LOC122037190 isoform X2 [Zingiber officinale]|uniref:uncharacterized protein LOC122037190 isoform X2 n=1 Tax=Zingiber officinale TaxID=94328 RepID=UPI001C4C9592|nr:uncharacterized protein LOC122037190 isoform X2 [Zingiber officinale]
MGIGDKVEFVRRMKDVFMWILKRHDHRAEIYRVKVVAGRIVPFTQQRFTPPCKMKVLASSAVSWYSCFIVLSGYQETLHMSHDTEICLLR